MSHLINDITTLCNAWGTTLAPHEIHHEDDELTTALRLYAKKAYLELRALLRLTNSDSRLFNELCTYLQKRCSELLNGTPLQGSQFFYTANFNDSLLTSYCIQIAKLLHQYQPTISPHAGRRPIYGYLIPTLTTECEELTTSGWVTIDSIPLTRCIISSNGTSLIPVSILSTLSVGNQHRLKNIFASPLADGSSSPKTLTEDERERLFAHSPEARTLHHLYDQLYSLHLTTNHFANALVNLITHLRKKSTEPPIDLESSRIKIMNLLKTSADSSEFESDASKILAFLEQAAKKLGEDFLTFWDSLSLKEQQDYASACKHHHNAPSLFHLIEYLKFSQLYTVNLPESLNRFANDKSLQQRASHVPIVHAPSPILLRDTNQTHYHLRIQVAHFLKHSTRAHLLNGVDIPRLLTLRNAHRLPTELPTASTTKNILMLFFKKDKLELRKHLQELFDACQKVSSIFHGIFYLLATQIKDIPHYLILIQQIIQHKTQLMRPLMSLTQLANEFEFFLPSFEARTLEMSALATQFAESCKAFEDPPPGKDSFQPIPFQAFLLLLAQIKSIESLTTLLLTYDNRWSPTEEEKDAIANKIDKLIQNSKDAITVVTALIAQEKAKLLIVFFDKLTTRLIHNDPALKNFIVKNRYYFFPLTKVHYKNFITYFEQQDIRLFFVSLLSFNQFNNFLYKLNSKHPLALSKVSLEKINFFCYILQHSSGHLEVFCEFLRWNKTLGTLQEWKCLLKNLSSTPIKNLSVASQLAPYKNLAKKHQENIALLWALQSEKDIILACEQRADWFKNMLTAENVSQLLILLNGHLTTAQSTHVCQFLIHRLNHRDANLKFSIGLTVWQQLECRLAIDRIPKGEQLLTTSFTQLFVQPRDRTKAITELAHYVNNFTDHNWFSIFFAQYATGLTKLFKPTIELTENDQTFYSYKNFIHFLSTLKVENVKLVYSAMKELITEIIQDPIQFAQFTLELTNSSHVLMEFFCEIFQEKLSQWIPNVTTYIALIDAAPTLQKIVYFNALRPYLPTLIHSSGDYIQIEQLIDRLPVSDTQKCTLQTQLPLPQVPLPNEAKFSCLFKKHLHGSTTRRMEEAFTQGPHLPSPPDFSPPGHG